MCFFLLNELKDLHCKYLFCYRQVTNCVTLYGNKLHDFSFMFSALHYCSWLMLSTDISNPLTLSIKL